MKNITYTPTGGVCARQIEMEIDGDIVRRVTITGGCAGNSQGVSRLVEGMHVDDVVKRLRHIDCKGKGTSCPDQLARALILHCNK